MDRVVLAVDGQERLALAARLRGDQFSGRDQAFFIGQADGLAGLDGFVGGFQPRHADDGADHEIDFRMSRYPDRSRCSVNDFDLAAGVLRWARRISASISVATEITLGFQRRVCSKAARHLPGSERNNLEASG